MSDKIFDIITDHSVNEGMNDILFENEKYMGIQKEIDDQTEQFENLGLTKEQRLVADRLISSYTASGACYGRLTYRKGFQDCISLLQEMCLIGAAYR
ncbi:MAG: hypothetical protein HDR09_02365 [Lachnospiraceae bacterium]|nr:hypothetical protein [Lachnospiraceae bacterium]